MGSSGVNFFVGCGKPGLRSIRLVLHISARLGDGRESKQFSFTPCVDCLSLSLRSADSFSSFTFTFTFTFTKFFNTAETFLTDSCVVTYIVDFNTDIIAY